MLVSDYASQQIDNINRFPYWHYIGGMKNMCVLSVNTLYSVLFEAEKFEFQTLEPGCERANGGE